MPRSRTMRALFALFVALTPASVLAQDRDGDLAPDATDGCPDAAETYDGIDDGDGCPEEGATPFFHATATEIVLDARIPFDLDDAEIQPAAFALLDALAALLSAHPELGVVRIEGHMDPATWEDRRDMSSRLWLDRARAVVAYLVSRGVPTSRLVADGRETDAPLCDSSIGSRRARRACRRRNDRIVIRRAAP